MAKEKEGAKRPRSGEERFAAYLDAIVAVLGHASRAAAARAYCTGLLLPGERKSIEPMAARIAPARVQAAHQSLHHVVAKAVWDDAALLRAVREQVLPAIERHGPVRYRIVDEIGFATKTAIALGQIRQALDEGVPVGVVLGDAGYGDECDFRVGVAALDLRYVLGIRSATTIWPPGRAPLPPAPWSGRGRPPTRLRRGPEHQPASVSDLALSLPRHAWRTVTWREGSRTELASRFAVRRIRPAHRDIWRTEPWPEEWLLIEWPE